MKIKKIVTCIISFILFTVCIPFTAVAEENENLVYPVKLNWEATSNTDGTSPITGTLDANIIIAPDRHSAEIVASSDFEVWFPIKITSGLFDFINCDMKYIISNDNLTTSNSYTLDGKRYPYYYVKNGNSSFMYRYNTSFQAGSVINCGHILYSVSNVYDIYMKDTDDVTYGTEQEQYIKQLEEENKKLKEQLNNPYTGYIIIEQNNGTAAERFPVTVYSDGRTETTEEFQNYINSLNVKIEQLMNRINLISDGSCGDIDGDGNISVEDAQLLLQYYTESKVAQLTDDPIDVWYFVKFGKG